ncbi:hypothetical protein [Sulfurospirillum sp.]|uniref:hypothetical protein n=1 Tax=Sulfurospirillum sp. TaxID=2053622 RepID=UPI002FDD6AAF
MSIVIYCYQSLFKCKPHGQILDLIVKADRLLAVQYTEKQLEAIQQAIEKKMDIEYLEYLSRRKNLSNPLTVAFKIASSLGESSPEYYHRFVNTNNNRLMMGYILIKAVLKTMACIARLPMYNTSAKEISNA